MEWNSPQFEAVARGLSEGIDVCLGKPIPDTDWRVVRV